MRTTFLSSVCALLERISAALPDPRPRPRVTRIGLGLLCGDVPKTISSAIMWNGTGGDWSSDYRLFSKTEWNEEDLFNPVLADAVNLSPHGPIYAAMDDTLLRKTGRNMPGTSIARDPHSPPFHTNLVLGQRFLETAVMVHARDDHPWRAVPVSFRHAPPLKAPPRATEQEKQAVKKASKNYNMSTVGREELAGLRARIDRLPEYHHRRLIMTADGSFANRAFLSNLPDRTTVVVRIRKDARLRAVLPVDERTGNRKYGAHLPAPEQMITDQAIPVQAMTVFVGGRNRLIKYKVIDNVCWPRATGDRPAKLILLKPLGYRLRNGGKLLYKQPAYLFVTGSDADIKHVIQAYLLRWEIEVSFRDEKTVLGTGKAQVWNKLSVGRTPAFLVACYACLLLASIKTLKDSRNELFDPLPPWRQVQPKRPSTRDLLRLLRKQVIEERKHQQSALETAA